MATTTTPEPLALPPGRASGILRRFNLTEELAHAIALTAGMMILVITAVIFYALVDQSALSRHTSGWKFLVDSTWDPVSGKFGALPFIYGTLVTSLLSLLIAIPLGVGAAIFLAEMAPMGVSNALTFLIELLAAVPSVIYGLIGVFVLVPILRTSVVPAIKSVVGDLPIFAGAFYGVSYFSAGIVLAVMIAPFIISVSREVLLTVPRDQREGALALGATKWQTTARVVVPYASTGILGSIFLALARALGETMAVTMVVGNTPQIKASLFAPGDSIASVVANQFAEATGPLYLSALIELALVLFGVTFVMNGLARIMILAAGTKGTHS